MKGSEEAVARELMVVAPGLHWEEWGGWRRKGEKRKDEHVLKPLGGCMGRAGGDGREERRRRA